MPRMTADMISTPMLTIRGNEARGFGIIPWLVWISAVLTIVPLAFFPDSAPQVLTWLFPAWALAIAFGVDEDIVAPVYSFPIFYLLWLWIGSITILPASNLPLTLLDPIPPR